MALLLVVPPSPARYILPLLNTADEEEVSAKILVEQSSFMIPEEVILIADPSDTIIYEIITEYYHIYK